MADKKLEKALYGPSTTEVALGAILGLAAGLLAAGVYLVFKPVSQVKEMPKEPVRGMLYYLPGAEGKAKSQAWQAKQKAFLGGGAVDLNEEELNAWAATVLAGAPAPAAPKPGAKAPEPAKPADQKPAYDGIFNPGAPNFRFVDGEVQVGAKCVLNWYGLTQEVMVIATGTLQRTGDDVVFVPHKFYLGSCPVHLIPGLQGPLLNHVVSRFKVPDEVKSAWAKVNEATIVGSVLKITME